jgi:hypothetical protein
MSVSHLLLYQYFLSTYSKIVYCVNLPAHWSSLIAPCKWSNWIRNPVMNVVLSPDSTTSVWSLIEFGLYTAFLVPHEICKVVVVKECSWNIYLFNFLGLKSRIFKHFQFACDCRSRDTCRVSSSNTASSETPSMLCIRKNVSSQAVLVLVVL